MGSPHSMWTGGQAGKTHTTNRTVAFRSRFEKALTNFNPKNFDIE